jgi:hypothetical protein
VVLCVGGQDSQDAGARREDRKGDDWEDNMKLDLDPREVRLITDALNSVVECCEVEGVDENVDSSREFTEGLIGKIEAARLAAAQA